MTHHTIIQSPIGQLTVATNGTTITDLHIEGDRYFTAIPSDWQPDPAHPLLLKAKQQIDEYFQGKRKTFDLPISLAGTDFQKAVWQTLVSLPLGSTISYGQIAAQIGKPKAVRAVGSAVGRNKICLIVPCHRVLGFGGKLGGFSAGIECKQQLLKLERISYV